MELSTFKECQYIGSCLRTPTTTEEAVNAFKDNSEPYMQLLGLLEFGKNEIFGSEDNAAKGMSNDWKIFLSFLFYALDKIILLGLFFGYKKIQAWYKSKKLSDESATEKNFLEEFVSQDTKTLDVTVGATRHNKAQVVSTVFDADPSLESLIVGDPSVKTGTSLATAPATIASNSNPILMLDQDHISCLENVLQSAEAKGMLGEVLVPSEHSPDNPEASLVDLTSGGAGDTAIF